MERQAIENIHSSQEFQDCKDRTYYPAMPLTSSILTTVGVALLTKRWNRTPRIATTTVAGIVTTFFSFMMNDFYCFSNHSAVKSGDWVRYNADTINIKDDQKDIDHDDED
eukprot:TRINITY_DN9975_c0_g1_i1.p1 TRINITY_DN9975_c0_g1~~TRINITY_DN9975_c0_g1_i1.p1  ORF type:complete len:110 (-),score=17.67 TRINITY_DN9975_c0_g1_i1:72-401(-)